MQNRAVPGLTAADFEATESGEPREVLSARPTTAPVNLVLLVDVSGSIENYVTFIRKSARAFITTADPNDRISIILFNEDVKELTGFSTDRRKLSESLDTFDAGGATAYYDALGYTITDVLRPFRGERTAIVVLSDGDDNRSFLPFDSLMGSIEESGALIYPLYVPTSLIAAASQRSRDRRRPAPVAISQQRPHVQSRRRREAARRNFRRRLLPDHTALADPDGLRRHRRTASHVIRRDVPLRDLHRRRQTVAAEGRTHPFAKRDPNNLRIADGRDEADHTTQK